MKTNVHLAALTARTACAVIVLLAVGACSLGLDPASNDTARKASLELKIGALVPPASSFAEDSPAVSGSRLVAPDYGYLYFRTIGGPVGSSGPFYGPFRIDTGETFTTTAIPAGTYAGIGVLYATKPLEGLTVEVKGATRTFTELMGLPDDEFNLITDSSGEMEGPTPFDLLLSGWASGEMVDNVTIVEGKKNFLTVTLLPITGDSTVNIWNGEETFDRTGNPAVLERRFIALEGVNPTEGYTINSLSVNIYPEGATNEIGRCMLFSEEGAFVRDFGTVGTVSETRTLTAAYTVPYSTEGTDFYCYIEYQTAQLRLGFEASETVNEVPPVTPVTQTLTVSFAGNADYEGMRMFYAVYPISSFTELIEDPTMIPVGDPVTSPVATGMIMLDSSGSGSGLAYATGGSTVMTFADGAYYITAFIDIDGTYADVSSYSDAPGGFASIVPNYGDMVLSPAYVGVPVLGASATCPLTVEDFALKENYSYFVDQNGVGGGLRPDQPCALSSLLERFALSNENEYDVKLIGDVDLPSRFAVNCASVTLESYGSSVYTLTTSFSNTSESPVALAADSSLSLRNIEIDFELLNYNVPKIDASGFLFIMDGTRIIKARNDSGLGGAILFRVGSACYMSGGTIDNCSGLQGTIRVQAETAGTATFVMTGGTISNCTGNGSGTIILIGYQNSLGYAQFAMSGGSIVGCSSTTNGGGVFIAENGSMTLSGAAMISGCTANNGGGIYIESNGTLTLNGGTVTLCTATTGNGGGLYYPGTGLTDVNGLASTIFTGNIGSDIIDSSTLP